MDSRSLFVYGTLRHPPLLERLLGRVPDRTPALLAGHRVAPLGGVDYPGLVVDPGCTANGELMACEGLEVALLDSYEGPQYERVPVVVVADGVQVDADVWRLRSAYAHLVLDGRWDFDHFVENQAERWMA